MTSASAGIRRHLFDIVLAVALTIVTAATTIGADPDHRPGRGAFALIAVFGVLLALRRVWPEVCLFGTMAVLWVYLGLGYPEGPVYALPAIAVFTYVMVRSMRTSLIVLVALFFVNVAFHETVDSDDSLLLNLTITFIWLALPVTGGGIAREARRARAREREAERQRHRADERVAMAREIHDVVGHSLAVVSMNAGVALHVLEKRPDAAPGVIDNLRAIRDTSTRALDDLRATLVPLRQGRQPELRPAFTLKDIPDLVDDVRKGGLSVTCEIEGDADAVPPRIAATAYRVVQESLTNVIRHAEATSATARIDCGAGALTIDITDNGRGGEAHPGLPGQGITGMIERVQAQGGAFEAGPAPGGGFAVHAELPYVRSANLWLASFAKRESAHDRTRHRRRPEPHSDGAADAHRRRARPPPSRRGHRR